MQTRQEMKPSESSCGLCVSSCVTEQKKWRANLSAARRRCETLRGRVGLGVEAGGNVHALCKGHVVIKYKSMFDAWTNLRKKEHVHSTCIYCFKMRNQISKSHEHQSHHQTIIVIKYESKHVSMLTPQMLLGVWVCYQPWSKLIIDLLYNNHPTDLRHKVEQLTYFHDATTLLSSDSTRQRELMPFSHTLHFSDTCSCAV